MEIGHGKNFLLSIQLLASIFIHSFHELIHAILMIKQIISATVLIIYCQYVYSQNIVEENQFISGLRIHQVISSDEYLYELIDSITGIRYPILEGKIIEAKEFEEIVEIPVIQKIMHFEFDQKPPTEIVLEFFVKHELRKGESGANIRKEHFLKIMNPETGKTLLKKMFFEEFENFYYLHNLKNDFIKSGDHAYYYRNSRGFNYYIGKNFVYFLNVEEHPKRGEEWYYYNEKKESFEKN